MSLDSDTIISNKARCFTFKMHFASMVLLEDLVTRAVVVVPQVVRGGCELVLTIFNLHLSVRHLSVKIKVLAC